MPIKQKVIKGVKWTTLSTIVITLCTILKFSILARLLNKEDFGLMAIITFVLGFVELFMDMGISSAILHKQKIAKNEYSSLYWLNIIFSIFILIIIFIFSPLFAVFYNEPSLNYLIPLASASILIFAIGRQFKTILQKELNFKRIACIEISSAIISLVSAIIFAINGYGTLSLIYSFLINYAISNFTFFALGIKNHPIKFHFNFQETKEFLRIGVFQVGSQIVNYFNRDLDILLIGKFFGSDILGGYSLAKQLAFRPAQVINPILTQVASPTLSKLQNNLDQLKIAYLKLVNIVSSINFIAYFLVFVFASPLIIILYGHNYIEFVPVIRILCIYMFIRSIGNPIGSLVVATGKTHLEFYWNLLTLLIMPILIIIGSTYTIEFVATLISLGMLCLVIPNWYFLVRRMIPVSLNEFLFNLVPKFKNLNPSIFLKK